MGIEIGKIKNIPCSMFMLPEKNSFNFSLSDRDSNDLDEIIINSVHKFKDDSVSGWVSCISGHGSCKEA